MSILQGPTIFKRDSAGKIRVWNYEVDGDKYRTNAGIEGGALVTSEWTVCKPKSRPTAEEQAQFEAEAEMVKKLDREYRESKDLLDTVPVSPMLAQDFAKQKKGVEFPVYSQPKLDGIRALINKEGAFTREYQRHYNVDHILAALKPIFDKQPDIQLDGELYNHDLKDNFNKIGSVVRKQKPTDEQRAEAARVLQYHIYDVIEPSGMNFGARWGWLKDLFGAWCPAEIVGVPTRLASTKEELDALQAQYIEAGYEGQMVRLDKPYEVDKRSKNLLKRKEWITEEFPLLAIGEGIGNWSGHAKTIKVKLPKPKTDGSIECDAGMRGTKEFARKILLEGSAKINDKSEVTVRYFGYTPDGALRFPVVVDWHFEGRAD